MARPRGFVLVATLWILAIVTIAAAYFAERVSRSIATAQQRQDTAEAMIAFADTRAELLFRMATTPPTFAGVGTMPPIRLDDRPYRGEAGDIVRVQENQGLLNLNFVQPLLLSRFLTQLGVPAERVDPMIDTLRDYTDADNLRRLNGAEAAEYAAQGLPPPPNDWLATPFQLKNVIGWREQRDLWEKQGLLNYVTTSRSGVLDPNTAPLQVLAALPGVTLENAQLAVKRRETLPFYAPDQIPGYLPGQLDPEFFEFFPTSSFRVTQQSPRLPWAIRFSITLTPLDDRRPWRIDYYARTAVSYAVENEAEIPKLPAWIGGPAVARPAS